MANETRKYDLDERLLEYSASVIRLVEDMAKTKAGNHVGGQLLRSGTSPYFVRESPPELYVLSS